MKKLTPSSSKIFFMLNVLLLFLALNLSQASAEFYVIAGSRGAGTEIKSLPYTILSAGFYYIKKDLSCAAVSHGITITADNVTLDLMGFSLIGSGDTGSYDGIYMNGQSNVEIRNGTVRNFTCGIYEDGASGTGHRIINIRARDNHAHGIQLDGYSHLIEKCTAVDNSYYGIWANKGSTIVGNTCYKNNHDGIHGGDGSTVTGNTCYDNTKDGIYSGVGSIVSGNTCYNNSEDGIHAWDGSTVTSNTCYSNSGRGISAAGGSTVTNNTCYDNDEYGIYLSGINLVDQNTCYANDINMNIYSSCVYGYNCAP